jgi:hypothetical protein
VSVSLEEDQTGDVGHPDSALSSAPSAPSPVDQAGTGGQAAALALVVRACDEESADEETADEHRWSRLGGCTVLTSASARARFLAFVLAVSHALMLRWKMRKMSCDKGEVCGPLFTGAVSQNNHRFGAFQRFCFATSVLLRVCRWRFETVQYLEPKPLYLALQRKPDFWL